MRPQGSLGSRRNPQGMSPAGSNKLQTADTHSSAGSLENGLPCIDRGRCPAVATKFRVRCLDLSGRSSMQQNQALQIIGSSRYVRCNATTTSIDASLAVDSVTSRQHTSMRTLHQLLMICLARTAGRDHNYKRHCSVVLTCLKVDV